MSSPVRHLAPLQAPGDAWQEFWQQHSTCGVTGFVHKQHAVDQIPCDQAVYTNCTLVYPLACPAECPVRVADSHLPCIFACIDPEDCSSWNALLSLPNLVTGTCETCPIEHCQQCIYETRCAKCFSWFALQEGQDGNPDVCEFILEPWLKPTLYALLAIILVLLGAAILYCLAGSRSPAREQNWDAIKFGRLQRHLSKLFKWHLDRPYEPVVRTSLFCNLHVENIIGVGLALFYNSIGFVAIVMILCYTVARHVYYNSEMYRLLPSAASDDNVLDKLTAATMSVPGFPSVRVSSDLQYCGNVKPGKLEEIMAMLANEKFESLLILYAIVFVISLAYAWTQRSFVCWFDRAHHTMSDFALLLEGLPEDLVDEVELRSWLNRELRPLMNGQVHGVSIAYNYEEHLEEVPEMLDRLDMHVLSHDDNDFNHHPYKAKLVQDAHTVQEWFSGPNKLQSSGCAFAVFELESDADFVYRTSLKNPNLLWHSKSDEPIRINTVKTEPPDIMWERMWFRDDHLDVGKRQALVKITLAFGIFNLAVVFPYNYFLVLPYAETGQFAGGAANQIAGIIMGIINGLLGAVTWDAAHAIGYWRKEHVMGFIQRVNVVTTFLNTAISIGMALYATGRASGFPDLLSSLRHSHDIGKESDMVRTIFGMFVPGWLFVGQIVGFVMGNVWPFLVNALLQKVIYYWRCAPDCLLHVLRGVLPWAPGNIDKYSRLRAEKGFRANPIGLAWDAVNLLTNPSVGFFTIGFVSPYTSKLFLALVAWTVFFYIFNRFVHLRVASISLHSSSHLHAEFLYQWAMPMGILGTACCRCGIRSGVVLQSAPLGLKICALLLTYILSSCLWAVALKFLVNPGEEEKHSVNFSHKVTVDDVEKRLIHSWYNCNPILVLKAQYCWERSKLGAQSVAHPRPLEANGVCLLYQHGKEYVYMTKHMQEIVNNHAYSTFEFESWCELLFLGLSQMESLCQRRARVALDESGSGSSSEDQEEEANIMRLETFSGEMR